jgi:hypothetical protein
MPAEAAPSTPPPEAEATAVLTLPFAADTAAAAFRRGGEVLVVFDEARPVDSAALAGHPPFDTAGVTVLPHATVLRVAVPPGQTVRLARVPGGWSLAPSTEAAAPAPAPIRSVVGAGRLDLPAAGANRVVALPDPLTGATLLVGTQTAPGESIAIGRRTPEFVLLPTLQGVVVEPVSDRDVLRATPQGFVLAADAARPLALAPEDEAMRAVVDAARLTRRWDFPALPLSALSRRLAAAISADAATPPQSRTPPRLAAAQAALALGLGAEAQGLALLAASDDGRAAEAPEAGALAAIGALLAGRTEESEAVDDRRLDGTDEVAFWRAVRRAAEHEGAPDAASVFAATLPLLLAYPAPLRERLLPGVAETMVLGGETQAARRLLGARPADTSLDMARAMLAEAEGRRAEALALYDRLAASPDRAIHARAAVRAVELHLAAGALTPSQAAEALDRLLYAWRGDERELALRQRIVELRAQGGDWLGALAMLRDTADGPVAADWAEKQPALRTELRDVFARALAADARAALPPLDLVALVRANPDLLPGGAEGAALAGRLADRMLALDLPGRAIPLLQSVMQGSPPGPARAELGARLASLALRQGDAAGALTALSDSVAEDVPAPLQERRTLLFARAEAARGELQPAVATLASVDSAAADDLRAQLLEGAQDWPGATAALTSLAGRSVPTAGPLDEAAARLLLRLASAAARSDDEGILALLRERDLPRMPPGQLADMLKLLTERPVSEVPDLPRAAAETALAGALPAALQALGPAAPGTGTLR